MNRDKLSNNGNEFAQYEAIAEPFRRKIMQYGKDCSAKWTRRSEDVIGNLLAQFAIEIAKAAVGEKSESQS